MIRDYLLRRKADKECRQLEVIKNSLMNRLGLDEVEALTIGLDVLDDLKASKIL